MSMARSIATGAFNAFMWAIVMTILVTKNGWGTAWRMFDATISDEDTRHGQ